MFAVRKLVNSIFFKGVSEWNNVTWKVGLGDSCPTATPVRIRKQGFRTIVYVGSYHTIFLKFSIKYDG